jgi:4-hydroxybenzoate polyprenyltransferase
MEFVYGGHLLSCGASGVIFTIVLILNLQFQIPLIIIPYLCTQIVYSYNHLREIKFDIDSNPERVKHIQEKRNLMVLLLVGYIVLLIALLLFTNHITILYVLLVVLGGILYTDYFKAQVSKLIVGSKNFYAAFFWALQLFLVPFYYKSQITLSYIFLFLITFLTAFINSTFFDIKDMNSDRKRNLKTFPVILGIRKTIYLLYGLKLITFIPLMIGICTSKLPIESLFFIFFIFYGLFYLSQALFSEGKNLRNLSYVIADGEYTFWPILLLLIKIIHKINW